MKQIDKTENAKADWFNTESHSKLSSLKGVNRPFHNKTF